MSLVIMRKTFSRLITSIQLTKETKELLWMLVGI